MHVTRSLLLLLAIALMATGCGFSLIGRDCKNNVNRIKFVNLSSMDESRSIFTLYEGSLPGESISAIQLWSWKEQPAPAEKAP